MVGLTLARQAQHLTQPQLAERAGVSERTVRRYENGTTRGRASKNTLRKLADALDTDVETLMSVDTPVLVDQMFAAVFGHRRGTSHLAQPAERDQRTAHKPAKSGGFGQGRVGQEDASQPSGLIPAPCSLVRDMSQPATPRGRTKLAYHRRAAGVTQPALAEATGISLRNIQRLENGDMTNPPMRYLISCAYALGLPNWQELVEDNWREPMPGTTRAVRGPSRS